MTQSKAEDGFDPERWQQLARGELGKAATPVLSRHGLELEPVYSARDLGALSSPGTPGVAPFRRGPYATMYTGKPWTIRQYAGFSTAEESNAFYRNNLKQGQRGLSVAFDLPTHRGYDSDHPRARGDVGKAGVAIDSVLDMARLFDGIDLGRTSVSMTMNGAVLPILAAYIVVADEQGCERKALTGTIQNDILKEFMVRNTYIYPPEPSLSACVDVIEFCSRNLPRFNPISVSGYHLQEAGATLVQELAYTLGNGLEYVKGAVERGLAADDFAQRLSFFFGIGTDLFSEVAKLRAARQLWAELMQERFAPRSAEALRLRMHCQTSGVSLTAQQPLNNVVRTTIEALAALLGGTQSLHTNSFDEALALPSDAAARVALDTQLILQHETDVASVVDPLGGSYFVESLTQQFVVKARAILAEVDAAGGMTRAIEKGIPQGVIERAAAERQVRVDRGVDVVVGVNKFTRSNEPPPQVRVIDHEHVERAQAERLAALRSSRSAATVKERLAALGAAAASRSGNLLELAIECMRARATVGEVSLELENVWGRYQATGRSMGGVFAKGYESEERWAQVRRRVEAARTVLGRNPRILIAKLGQDGHDRGAKVVAAGFADAGFDVDLAPLFQTPAEVARAAIDHDVHVVGISTLAGGHRALVPELLRLLEQEGASEIRVVCGGIIPEVDRAALLQLGVASTFTPGTPVVAGIEGVLDLLPGAP
jgi:methylmalonyl-CoA mutase